MRSELKIDTQMARVFASLLDISEIRAYAQNHPNEYKEFLDWYQKLDESDQPPNAAKRKVGVAS